MNFWKKYLPFFIYIWVMKRIIRRIKKHAIRKAAKNYWPEMEDKEAIIPSMMLYSRFSVKPDFEWETMRNRILIPVEKHSLRVVFSISRDIKLRHAFWKSFDFVEVNREEDVHSGRDDIYAEMEKKTRGVTKEKLRAARFLKRDRTAAVSVVPTWDASKSTYILHTCAGKKETFALVTSRAVLDDTTPADFQNLLETPNPKKIETRTHIADAFYLTTDEERLGEPEVLLSELKKESTRCSAAAVRELKQLEAKTGTELPFFFREALTGYCAASFFNPRSLDVFVDQDGNVAELLVTGYDSLMNEVKDEPLGKLLSTVPGSLSGFVFACLVNDAEPVSVSFCVDHVTMVESGETHAGKKKVIR